ncbi:hypothetical protein BZG09_12750 [Salinivibrio kushneri]|uniref:Uncharacterized protein n=1 Tax=Salinivibrio kushneri TaxID=1908198 RepID=A0AB36K515_9GAMM|nr:hypothetical protein BZG09_12750 [Salinivibrio kushneri]
MYVLVCEQPFNGTFCPSGAQSVTLDTLLAQAGTSPLTMDFVLAVMPQVLAFLALCWGFSAVRRFIWR